MSARHLLLLWYMVRSYHTLGDTESEGAGEGEIDTDGGSVYCITQERLHIHQAIWSQTK